MDWPFCLALTIATLVWRGFSKNTLIELGFLILPGVITVALISRIFLPETSKLTYSFLGRGENLSWIQGVLWCFDRLISDYAPYKEAMIVVLLLVAAVVWLKPNRRVRGLTAGSLAAFLLIAFNSGKYWASLLVIIPIIALFPALALEAAIKPN